MTLARFIIDGRTVERGDRIEDFRGDTWEFDRITRMPDGRSTGKVYVRYLSGAGCQEFYPAVFKGQIVVDAV